MQVFLFNCFIVYTILLTMYPYVLLLQLLVTGMATLQTTITI